MIGKREKRGRPFLFWRLFSLLFLSFFFSFSLSPPASWSTKSCQSLPLAPVPSSPTPLVVVVQEKGRRLGGTLRGVGSDSFFLFLSSFFLSFFLSPFSFFLSLSSFFLSLLSFFLSLSFLFLSYSTTSFCSSSGCCSRRIVL